MSVGGCRGETVLWRVNWVCGGRVGWNLLCIGGVKEGESNAEMSDVNLGLFLLLG